MTARKSSRKAAEDRPLDPVDRSILKVLRDDARISLRELATRVKISRANAYARVGRLTEQGVIQGFTVRIDPRKAGLGISALIALTIDQRRWRALLEKIPQMPEVESCAVTAGEFDMVILARAPSLEMIRDVVLERLHQIEGVEGTRTFFVLEETAPRAVILP